MDTQHNPGAPLIFDAKILAKKVRIILVRLSAVGKKLSVCRRKRNMHCIEKQTAKISQFQKMHFVSKVWESRSLH